LPVPGRFDIIDDRARFAVPMKSPAIFLILVLAIALGGILAPESADPEHRHYPCKAIEQNSQDSAYMLPYSRGTKYRVNQANCSGHGHSNFWNHGYDFVMDIGTPVLAARAGQVGWAKDGCHDGDRRCTNLVTIIHADGTVALYSHLTNGGVTVRQGQRIASGQVIGKSGDTGNTGGLPHLHFSVHPCNHLPGLPNPGACPTTPVNFRNTASNPNGLIAAQAYIAE
jgi:murein DD-endopeptidase MepM/ murein hydrolase activator NlpD